MMPSQACPSLTADEYWRMFHLIRGDVEVAIAGNCAYLTTHNLAATERAIFEKYNRAADFWRLHTYALQTTFFIAFGRIFDKRTDSISIQKLVEATIQNPWLFSKTALRERKRESSKISDADPEWLIDYLNTAWEPTKADLEPLMAALTPHCEKFRQIYQPIRHKYFAHRGTESEQAIAGLFQKTLIGDVAEILRFLHTLLWAITEMAWNARRPDLTNFHDYEGYVNGLNRKTESFIHSLP